MANKVTNHIQGDYVTDKGYEEFECTKDGITFWVIKSSEGLIFNVESKNSDELINKFNTSGFNTCNFKVNEEVFDETGTIYITFNVKDLNSIERLKKDFLNIYDFNIVEKWESKNDSFPYNQFVVEIENEKFIVTTQEFECEINGKFNHILYCSTLNNIESLFQKLKNKGYDVNDIELDEEEFCNHGFISFKFTIDYGYDLEDLTGKIEESQ